MANQHPIQLSPQDLEYKYKYFSFKLTDGNCDPSPVGEFLTEQAAAGWVANRISEVFHDGHLIVIIYLMRPKVRNVIPAQPIPTFRGKPKGVR